MDNNISERNQQAQLEDHFAEFERQNPQVAEAMKVLGMTMAEYERVLYAMSAPKITHVRYSNSEDYNPYGNQK